MDKELLPVLADIIVKVNLKQDLSETEAQAYLRHIKKFSEKASDSILAESYQDGKLVNRNKLDPYLDNKPGHLKDKN